MLEGASLSSALETVSIGLSAQARAALQSIVYDVIRRRAFSNAAAAGLLSSPPPPPVMGLLEIAIALVVEGRYSDFTLVNETVMQHATTAEPYALQGSSMPCCADFYANESKFQQFYKKTWMFASTHRFGGYAELKSPTPPIGKKSCALVHFTHQ